MRHRVFLALPGSILLEDNSVFLVGQDKSPIVLILLVLRVLRVRSPLVTVTCARLALLEKKPMTITLTVFLVQLAASQRVLKHAAPVL